MTTNIRDEHLTTTVRLTSGLYRVRCTACGVIGDYAVAAIAEDVAFRHHRDPWAQPVVGGNR